MEQCEKIATTSVLLFATLSYM